MGRYFLDRTTVFEMLEALPTVTSGCLWRCLLYWRWSSYKYRRSSWMWLYIQYSQVNCGSSGLYICVAVIGLCCFSVILSIAALMSQALNVGFMTLVSLCSGRGRSVILLVHEASAYTLRSSSVFQRKAVKKLLACSG